MKQPSDLELLIVPYLAGKLATPEHERVEAAIAEDPEYARLVAELRATLLLVEAGAPSGAEARLAGLEGRIYREVVARKTIEEIESRRRRWSVLRPASQAGDFLRRIWWQALVSATAVAAASVILSVYLTGQAILPTRYEPVAVLQPPPRATAEAPKTSALHERFLRQELEQALDEARLVHHVRGDVNVALAHYAQIRERNPDGWAWRTATEERSSLLAATTPLRLASTQPVFLDASER